MSCILVAFEGYEEFVVSSRSRLASKTLSTNSIIDVELSTTNSGSLYKGIFVHVEKVCCSVILASSWFCTFSSSDTMSYVFWILSATFTIHCSASLSLEFFFFISSLIFWCCVIILCQKALNSLRIVSMPAPSPHEGISPSWLLLCSGDRQTDRQTHGQTDGQMILHSSRKESHRWTSTAPFVSVQHYLWFSVVSLS